jgi:hypothetical protein
VRYHHRQLQTSPGCLLHRRLLRHHLGATVEILRACVGA